MPARPILIATARVAAAGLALAAALAGCATTDDGDAAGPTPAATATATGTATSADEADIAFAQLMIPHHEQAIEMADLAAASATSEDVRALATQIRAAQAPEIELMTQWLGQWGAPTAMPSTTDDGMDHGDMDMGGMTAAGMMSAEDMAALHDATGAEFDQMWLQMMIAHHEGAITMAQQVAAVTTDPEVAALAEAIVGGQTAEIATMQQLLAS